MIRGKSGLVAWSLLLCFVSPSLVRAQTAETYVDSAVAAIGGREALLGLKSQRIVSHGENFEPDQAVLAPSEARDLGSGGEIYEIGHCFPVGEGSRTQVPPE